MFKFFPVSKWQGKLSLTYLLLAAIAIAVVLRIVYLGSREFWYDETLSLLLSTGQKNAYRGPGDTPMLLSQVTALLSLPAESNLKETIQTFRDLIKGLWGGEPHPPFFFLSQHLWLRMWGNTEAATRSLSALWSIGTLYSAYGLGRVLLGQRGGLMLAALLGLNPFFLFHSLNFRMYSPLVLWTVLSAWALLELIEQPSEPSPNLRRSQVLWSSVLILSVAAGCLTFYLFAYWIVVLAAIALYRDRQRWWQHGLRLGTGLALTVPWILVGTLKQLRNADLKRFGASQSIWESGLKRAQDVAQILGVHLLVGDWVTSIPLVSVLLIGTIILGLLVYCIHSLWHRANRQTLTTIMLLGVFPLGLGLAVDIATSKFTLGFGWGRAMIFILPGCLLLPVFWLEQTKPQWREWGAIAMLTLYLVLSLGDYSLRQRQPFHQIATLVQEQPSQTLIVMNTKAWGHVTRLAYYIPPDTQALLLAQPSQQLAESLATTLRVETPDISNILWLDSARPIWSAVSTPAEREQVEQVLQPQFSLVSTQTVTGTMDLDQFTAKLYTRSAR